MTALRTRRAALRAGAAVIGALCVPAVALAQPAPAADLDAELFRLLDRWHAIGASRNASDAAFDVALVRAEAAYPPRPDALWSDFGDSVISLGVNAAGREKQPDGRIRSFFYPGDVENLRARKPVTRWVITDDAGRARREPDPEGEARRQEIIAASDRWQADRKAVQDATGYTAALEASDAAVEALNEAEDAVSAYQPRTMAGLARKAAWVADLLARDAAMEDLGEVFARQVAAFCGVAA